MLGPFSFHLLDGLPFTHAQATHSTLTPNLALNPLAELPRVCTDQDWLDVDGEAMTVADFIQRYKKLSEEKEELQLSLRASTANLDNVLGLTNAR